MGLAASVISKYMIDAVVGHKSEVIMTAAILYAGSGILRILFSAVNSRISARITIQVDQEIRTDVFKKTLDAEWEAMSEFHTGDLLNRLDNDVSTVSSSVLGWIPELVTKLVQFIGALLIILYYDPTLAILALLSAPVTFAVSSFLMKRMREYNKKTREVSSEVMAFNEEAFQNIQHIKALGLNSVYRKKLERVQEDYKDVQLDYNKFAIRTSSFMSTVGMLVSYICFAWSVYRLWTGHISYGTMTMFLQLAAGLSASFGGLVSMVPKAIGAATAAGRIMAVVELAPEDTSNEAEAEALYCSGSGIVVKAENLQFAYQSGREVFSHADFTVRPNEIAALIGPSGEGKTTMLRILLGLLKPQGGAASVSLADNPQKGTYISPGTRKLFSYVPQGNTMFSGTIADNLRLVKPEAADEEIRQALREACAYEEFVAQLPGDINSRVKERGGGFSEGQAQRLSIARALLGNAPVLLLDEATSALDAETEERVLANILKSGRNRTCIITTHRASVLDICTSVYRISGKKVEKL